MWQQIKKYAKENETQVALILGVVTGGILGLFFDKITGVAIAVGIAIVYYIARWDRLRRENAKK